MPPSTPSPDPGNPSADLGDRELGLLEEVLELLEERVGRDFRAYRRPTLLRRVRRRVRLAGLGAPEAPRPGEVPRPDAGALEEYLERLRADGEELRALSADLNLRVTELFRDPEAWEALEEPLRELVRSADDGGEPFGRLRMWIPGCATGEEAYSLAMLVYEIAEAEGAAVEPELFATDTDPEALAVARRGVYPAAAVEALEPGRRERFFRPDEGFFEVRSTLRHAVVFARHDLLAHAPFSHLDLVSCRNVLVYLEPEAEERVRRLFHFSLRPGGVLFLGSAEALGVEDEGFEAIDRRCRIYRRTTGGRGVPVLPPAWASDEPVAAAGARRRPSRGLPARPAEGVAQAALARFFAPPAVLVDGAGRILHFHGETGEYLSLPAGTPRQELPAMARGRLRPAVELALRRAREGGGSSEAEALLGPEEDLRPVRVVVRPAPPDPDGRDRFLVAFVEPPGERLAGVEQERVLRGTREDLRSTVEELEISHQEVLSSRAELQVVNEELLSSQEELRSMNEELRALNERLESKVEELEAVTADLHNLLDSTEIGTLFLDAELAIRRFTPPLTHLFGILPRDVGRPLGELEPRVRDPELVADARRVLEDGRPREAEVEEPGGRWYLRRVLPYRLAAEDPSRREAEERKPGRAEGVVVTYHEVTALKRAESELAALNRELERRIEERTEHLRLLQDVTTVANMEPDEEEAIRGALARIAAYDGWTVGHYHRIAEGGGLEPARVWYVKEGWEEATEEVREVVAETRLETGRGLAGRAAEDARPRWLVEGGEIDDPRLEVLERTGLEGAVAFPVMVGQEVAAVVEFFARHRIEPSPEVLGVMGNIGVQLGRVLERARARQRLSRLALEEQRRIGEELHEGLGQQITGLAMVARSLRRRLTEEGAEEGGGEGDGTGEDDRRVALARQLEEGAQDARELVRSLAKGLVALQLEERSLEEALQEMASDLCDHRETECRVEVEEGLAVGDERIVTCLYRVAREAVNNALLHAEAGEVVLRLRRGGRGVVLEVEDDGVGFVPGRQRGGGMGMGIMEERARLADGALEVDSAPGRGTRVRCTVPLGGGGR